MKKAIILFLILSLLLCGCNQASEKTQRGKKDKSNEDEDFF